MKRNIYVRAFELNFFKVIGFNKDLFFNPGISIDADTEITQAKEYKEMDFESKLLDRLKKIDCPTLSFHAKQILTHTHSDFSDYNPSTLITSLFLYCYGNDSLKSLLQSRFPQYPYEAFNSPERIDSYIKDTLLAGSESLRRSRLFSIGHQRSGKSSLLQSLR